MATTPRVKLKSRLPIQVLDRSRPFGDVYGETSHQIRYTQNAKRIEAWPYDVHDNLILDALNEKQAAAFKAMVAAAGIKPEDVVQPEDVAEEEAADAAAELASADDYVEPDATSTDDDGINLVLWLKGEQRVKHGIVQKVLKARFGVNKPSTQQQALYLVEEQKLLPRDEVHVSILPKQSV